MNKLRLSFIFLLLLLHTNSANACSCGIKPDMLEYLNFAMPNKAAKLTIVKATVAGTWEQNQATLLHVWHTYYGTPRKDTVICWGDQGDQCKVNLNIYYTMGDTILAVLEDNDNGFVPPDKKDDYFVHLCAHNHLRIYNDSVFGGSVTGFTFFGYPLPTFEDSLNNLLHTLSIADHKTEDKMIVYPNPASNLARLSLPASTGDVNILLKDLTGKTIKIVTRHLSATKTNIVDIDLQGLQAGLYYLYLEMDNKRRALPLIVQ